MKLLCTAGTDIGKGRSNNEDAYLVDEGLGLYVVCDGMGGHQSGEIASANAVAFIQEGIQARKAELARYVDGLATAKDVRAVLRSVLETANYKLREMAISDPSLEGMGTTAVVLLVLGSHAFIGHVGDSRIYLFRDDNVHVLTEDHSIGAEIQKKSSLPREYRSALTRALGVYDTVDPDVLSFDLFPGDGLLLASDGLYAYFSPRKLRDLLDETGPKDGQAFVKALIDRALKRGGEDNITGVYVYVDDDPEKHAYRIARKKLAILQSLNLFRFLTFTELLHLSNIAQALKFKPDTTIFSEGDEADGLYVILAGEVAVLKGGIELSRIQDGAHFGEMALIDKNPRSASIRTTQTTICLLIERADFYDLLRDQPNLAVKVLWSFVKVLSTRLRETSDELAVARALLKENAQPVEEPLEPEAQAVVQGSVEAQAAEEDATEEELEEEAEDSPPPLPNTKTFANMPAISPDYVVARPEPGDAPKDPGSKDDGGEA